MRRELQAISKLGWDQRLREEDPHTGTLADVIPTHVVVHVSRFEVDLNRPPDEAVYRRSEDAWDLDLWYSMPDGEQVARSMAKYEAFYGDIARLIEEAIAAHGRFVLYDVHSYNHRRRGPAAPIDDPAANPTVNLGTGTLPDRWRPVADAFLKTMADQRLYGEPIDTRENVRFRGGYLSKWTHDTYGEYGCSLAIEFKKVFMDEWTALVDPTALRSLRAALGATTEEVHAALEAA